MWLWKINSGKMYTAHGPEKTPNTVLIFFLFRVHFISNTLIRKARLKLPKKTKQTISSTLRLNFCCLKIIHILHGHYHPNVTRHILKNKQRNKYSLDYPINHNQNEDKYQK